MVKSHEIPMFTGPFVKPGLHHRLLGPRSDPTLQLRGLSGGSATDEPRVLESSPRDQVASFLFFF
jgi:hypothetical protein